MAGLEEGVEPYLLLAAKVVKEVGTFFMDVERG